MACLLILKSVCVQWWWNKNLSIRPLYFRIACYFLYWMYGVCYGFLSLLFHIFSFSFVKKRESFSSCSLSWAFLWRYWSGRTFTILRYTLNIARLCCWLLPIFLSYTLIKNKIKFSPSVVQYSSFWHCRLTALDWHQQLSIGLHVWFSYIYVYSLRFRQTPRTTVCKTTQWGSVWFQLPNAEWTFFDCHLSFFTGKRRYECCAHL